MIPPEPSTFQPLPAPTLPQAPPRFSLLLSQLLEPASLPGASKESQDLENGLRGQDITIGQAEEEVSCPLPISHPSQGVSLSLQGQPADFCLSCGGPQE